MDEDVCNTTVVDGASLVDANQIKSHARTVTVTATRRPCNRLDWFSKAAVGLVVVVVAVLIQYRARSFCGRLCRLDRQRWWRLLLSYCSCYRTINSRESGCCYLQKEVLASHAWQKKEWKNLSDVKQFCFQTTAVLCVYVCVLFWHDSYYNNDVCKRREKFINRRTTTKQLTRILFVAGKLMLAKNSYKKNRISHHDNMRQECSKIVVWFIRLIDSSFLPRKNP